MTASELVAKQDRQRLLSEKQKTERAIEQLEETITDGAILNNTSAGRKLQRLKTRLNLIEEALGPVVRYRVRHTYSGGKIHDWITTNPDGYLDEVAIHAPEAKLVSVEVLEGNP